MQDFMHGNLISQQIDREVNMKRSQKFDPDGLAQYEMWDEAFGGPTLKERLVGVINRFRKPRTDVRTTAKRHHSTECLPQG